MLTPYWMLLHTRPLYINYDNVHQKITGYAMARAVVDPDDFYFIDDRIRIF